MSGRMVEKSAHTLDGPLCSVCLGSRIAKLGRASEVSGSLSRSATH